MALLAFLAANMPRMCRRDTLLATFWPESDDERARAALRKALHFIRQEAGEIIVTRGTDEVGLAPHLIAVDLWELEQHTAGGRQAEALALYGGEFLPGFYIRGAPAFERWLDTERSRLQARVAEAAWLHVEALARRGDRDDARVTAVRAFELAPHDEVGVRRLMSLLAGHGDRSGAISVYQAFAARVAVDLEVEPAPETHALVASIISSTLASGHAPAASIAAQAPSTVPASIAAPISPPTARSQRRRWGLIAASVAAITAAIAYGAGSSRAATNPSDVRMAVFPFLVRGSTDTRYLQDGLPILLGTRLDGAGSLRSVDPRATFLDITRENSDETITPERANESAARLGARYFVLGTVVGSASKLHFDVSLYDREQKGARVARAEVSGGETDLMQLVDRVATQLLAGTLHDDRGSAKETAAQTSTSLVALKAWLRGESALAAGRYLPAIDAFQAAIAADSTFAMAHYRLALAANWAGEMSLVGPESQRAVDYSARLKPSERTTVEAFWHARRGHYAVAESLYRTVLAVRPAAVESWYDLAEVQYHGNPQRGRPIAGARDAFEQVLRLDPKHFASNMHLARLAAARRDRPTVDRLTSAALEGDPDGTHRAELLLLRALSAGDAPAAANFLAGQHSMADLDALWRSAEYTGSLERVSEIAESLLRVMTVPEQRSSLRLLLAHLAMGREDVVAAERHIDSLARLSPKTAAMTRVLLAAHPGVPDVSRGPIISRARAALDAARRQRAGVPVYIGQLRADSLGHYEDLFPTVLALASGDTASARRWLARTADSVSAASFAFERRWVALLAAGDPASRAAQRAELARLGREMVNKHFGSSPLLPRGLSHLAASRMFEAEGRRQEALAALDGVPEDLGFNVAYMKEIERRRAALRK